MELENNDKAVKNIKPNYKIIRPNYQSDTIKMRRRPSYYQAKLEIPKSDPFEIKTNPESTAALGTLNSESWNVP